MKHLRVILLALTFIFISTDPVDARLIASWSYQQLVDKSDLVIIAKPIATDDTKEQIDLPGFSALRVIGVETKLQVSAVLKGDQQLKPVILHHYRAPKEGNGAVNGPTLLSFNLSKPQSYLIFLVREPDGRYAPTSGQTDPALFSVHPLQNNLP